MDDFFYHLEISTRQEREDIAEKLIQLYRDECKDNKETLAAYTNNPESEEAKQAYAESNQRIETMLDIFEILGADIGDILSLAFQADIINTPIGDDE